MFYDKGWDGSSKQKEEENKKKKHEVTPPKDPLTKTETSNKRKVSPMKPSSQNKSKSSKLKLKTVLRVDDIDLIITSIADTSKDIL